MRGLSTERTILPISRTSLLAFITKPDGRWFPSATGFAKSDADARLAVTILAKRRGPKSAVAKYAKPTDPYGHVY